MLEMVQIMYCKFWIDPSVSSHSYGYFRYVAVLSKQMISSDLQIKNRNIFNCSFI
jgi:hypothetical protein